MKLNRAKTMSQTYYRRCTEFQWTFALVLLLMISVLLTSQASAQDLRLRMQSNFRINQPLFGETVSRFAQQVSRKTDGTIRIAVLAPNTVARQNNTLNAVADGAVDLAFTTPGFFAWETPALDFFTAVPFGVPGLSQYQWVRSGSGRRLFDEFHAQLGVKALPCALMPRPSGGWFSRPVQRTREFFGSFMVIRDRPGASVLGNLGANRGGIRDTELVPVLENAITMPGNMLTAVMHSTPAVDLDLGLDRATDVYYYPAWHRRETLLTVYFNLAIWRSLAPQQRRIVENVCHENVLHSYNTGRQQDAEALQTFRLRGIQPRQFPSSVLTGLRNSWNSVSAENSASDFDYRRVAQAYAAFRRARDESYIGTTKTTIPRILHPDRFGFYARRGSITGTLNSLGTSRHTLILEKQQADGNFATVRRVPTTARLKVLRHTATAGFFRWRVETGRQEGSYTLQSQFN